MEEFDGIVEAPEGYSLRSVLLYKWQFKAFFTWNKNKCSHKIKLSENNLKAYSLDGSGFKTVLGTEVELWITFIYLGSYSYQEINIISKLRS